jgi:hypothetical protein
MNQAQRQISQPNTALSYMTDGAVTQATPPTLQNEEDEENPALMMEELQQLIQ